MPDENRRRRVRRYGRPWWEVLVVAVFVQIELVRVGAAKYVLTHRRVGEAARWYGHVMLPAVLIGLGVTEII